MVTIYGRIIAESANAWRFRPATRLEPEPPLAAAIEIPKAGVAARWLFRWGLDAVRMQGNTLIGLDLRGDFAD